MRAPAPTFADERTITDVIGKPPSIPEIVFPIPCAMSSLFVGDTRLIGSNLSTASKLNSVSKLATTAMVKATVHTCLLVNNCEKSGDINNPKNSAADSTIGI